MRTCNSTSNLPTVACDFLVISDRFLPFAGPPVGTSGEGHKQSTVACDLWHTLDRMVVFCRGIRYLGGSVEQIPFADPKVTEACAVLVSTQAIYGTQQRCLWSEWVYFDSLPVMIPGQARALAGLQRPRDPPPRLQLRPAWAGRHRSRRTRPHNHLRS